MPKTTNRPTETLATTLAAVGSAPLADIPPAQAARVRRRIVDNEALAPRLDYAAFNSAPTSTAPAGQEELLRLAHQRLETVLTEETTTTLDATLERLFDRDQRELLTYSAFGSSL